MDTVPLWSEFQLHAPSFYFPWCPWQVSHQWCSKHIFTHRLILHPLILHGAHLEDVELEYSTRTQTNTSMQAHLLCCNFPLQQLSWVHFMIQNNFRLMWLCMSNHDCVFVCAHNNYFVFLCIGAAQYIKIYCHCKINVCSINIKTRLECSKS